MDTASTGHVERANLTGRMSMRRFARLTNAFSKKLRNLEAAFAVQAAYYDFCRVHEALRVTPAIQAGLTDHIWSLAEGLKTASALPTEPTLTPKGAALASEAGRAWGVVVAFRGRDGAADG